MAARIYVDSNVFIYAVDGAEELKARSKQTLERYIGEGHQLHSSELTRGNAFAASGAGMPARQRHSCKCWKMRL